MKSRYYVLIAFVVMVFSFFSCTEEIEEITTTTAEYASVYPAIGEANAYADGDISITFASKPRLVKGKCIYIYSSDGTTIVDTIKFTDATQKTLCDNASVGSQNARVEGNKVVFSPTYDKLEYEKTYKVIIPTETVIVNSSYFVGFSADSVIPAWTFTTKAAPSITGTTITVNGDKTSDSDFRTIHGALSYVSGLSGTYEIDIAAGTYYELLHYKTSTNNTVILHGPDNNDYGDTCVIKYISIYGMESSGIRGMVHWAKGNLVLENLTINNVAERGVAYTSYMDASSNQTQAEALCFKSGSSSKLSAYNCSFISHQDTLQTSGKAWFYNCYIEGDVDYIWGSSSVALFENCKLKSVADSWRSKITAMTFESRVAKADKVGKGYILYNSELELESGVTAYYGRRATAVSSSTTYYDQAAFINVNITGSGYLDSTHWYEGNASNGLKDTLYGNYVDVGWKEYNVKKNDSAVSTGGRVSDSGVIAEAEYNAEYNGRRAIINKVYNISSKAYERDTSTIWDIDSLISGRGYSVEYDSSSEN